MDPLLSLALFLHHLKKKSLDKPVRGTALDLEDKTAAQVDGKRERYLVTGDMAEGRYFEIPLRDGITKDTLWVRLSAKELWDLLHNDGRE